MLRDLTKLCAGEYDLLIIGGGINGAGIANIASRKGLKVALLEKGDFSSGTSSKSTKLIHGGIRYLENLEIGLVRESLKERYIQLHAAPHLVKPLGFVIPVYKGDKRPLWMIQLGVFLYDILANKYTINQHQRLSVPEISQLEPGITRDDLIGGAMYYDAQMDDSRLCLENILCAAENGAAVINYCEVVSFLKDGKKAVGVKVKDRLTKNTYEVRAKKIIAAVGPWTNMLLKLDDPQAENKARTTKGIHIVYPRQISRNAVLISSGRDKRVFFIIPWMGNSLIGTTDTDYSGSPDEVKVEKEDVDYLFNEARRVFPELKFEPANIITTFAGLRPLVYEKGMPSDVSRRHRILTTASELTFVIGGKYTTYRRIALDCLDRLFSIKEDEGFHVYGSGEIQESPQGIASEYGISLDMVKALIEKYGIRYKDVLKLSKDNPDLKQVVCASLPLIKAQIVYAVKTEMAKTMDDIIYRRLSMGYCNCLTKECLKTISEVLKNYG